MGTDTEVIRFMGGADGDVEKQTEIFWKIFKLYDEPAANETKLFWAIHEDKKLVGHVQLKPTIFTEGNELELVYMVHPDSRNKGVMNEVLALLKQVQAQWTTQIIVTIDFDNDISVRLMEKWGIVKREERIDPDDGVEYWKMWLAQSE